MEVSKFKIGKNIIDIKDAQARDDVVAAMNAAQDAQSTADQAVNGLATKQDISTALKYNTASKTFPNVTIPANSDYQFQIPIPDGVTNPRPIYARTSSLSLVMTNMYTVSSNIIVYLRNTSNASVTSDVTVIVTFLYN